MIGKLIKHDLRKIWKNEATNFTTWLEQNLDILSECIGIPLTLVKREHKVGSFSIDILASAEDGHKVIIENQLEKTDHTHLGQILTYISNLEAKTVIWISSEPRQEHINAVNWLNSQTNLYFYLLKIEAVSVDDSKPAPLFQIICEPDEDLKSAVSADSELTDREKFNVAFWASLNKKCETKLPGFTSRKPPKYHYHSQSIGVGGFSLVFLATAKFYGIELYIDTSNADLNEHLLIQIKQHKKDLEAAIGHALDFDDIPDKRACRVRCLLSTGKDVMDLDVDKVQAELIESMEKFEKLIKPIVRSLDFENLESA